MRLSFGAGLLLAFVITGCDSDQLFGSGDEADAGPHRLDGGTSPAKARIIRGARPVAGAGVLGPAEGGGRTVRVTVGMPVSLGTGSAGERTTQGLGAGGGR